MSQRYDKRIVFADHVDSNSDHALWLPIIALAAGAFAIEKHVMLSDRETKYDHYSSLSPDQFTKLSNALSEYHMLMKADFINTSEIKYLEGSEMKPIFIENAVKRSLVNPSSDFVFRRSGPDGLISTQILKMQNDRNFLSVDKIQGSTLSESDFKPAKIAAIIACRLKSSRLSKKALLRIGSLTSVEYCIKNTLRLSNLVEVILATSDLEQDSELVNHLYSDSVAFFQGNADDVLDRYLTVAKIRNIDVIVRITADMPFIDNKILQILLTSHFNAGADNTSSVQAAPGTNLEIIYTNALAKIKQYFSCC